VIRSIEINEAVRAWGLQHNVVEKDYALGWLLMGIGADPYLQTQWIFKGGTCLKKCYVETYRFSEDLDFTLTPQASRDPQEIEQMLRNLCGWVTEQCGIEFPPNLIEVRSAPNPRGSVTLRAKVGYRGPLQPPSMPKIQFDFTTDEIIVRPPIFRPVFHPYSDRPSTPGRVHCYPIEEVVAEKTRAMSERGRPRDLYDIVRLWRMGRRTLAIDPTAVMDILTQKCAHRGLAVPTLETLEASPNRLGLESEWANMLGHQLPALPPLDAYWAELPGYLGWLNGEDVPELPALAESEPSEASWSPPESISLPSAWGIAAPLETIRFAGANRLLIELNYRSEKGVLGIRVVEPYSFRYSRKGYLLFYGRNPARPSPISAYRCDRIMGVKVTTQPFRPIWRVEF
jgi:predicted nucleotidyltransferase component of viral defense system